MAPSATRKMPFITPSRCAASPMRTLVNRCSAKPVSSPAEQEHAEPHQLSVGCFHGDFSCRPPVVERPCSYIVALVRSHRPSLAPPRQCLEGPLGDCAN